MPPKSSANSTRRISKRSAKPSAKSRRRNSVEDEDEAIDCADGRIVATSKNEMREEIVYQMLKNQFDFIDMDNYELTIDCPIEVLTDTINELKDMYPSLESTVKWIGGRGKNFDYSFSVPVAGVMPDSTVSAMPGGMSDEMLRRMPGGMSDEMLRRMPGGMSDEMLRRMPGGMSDEMLSTMSRSNFSAMPGGMSDEMLRTMSRSNFSTVPDSILNIELKTSGKKINREKLEYSPWKSYGQLIQIFLNNISYKPLLDSFGAETMLQAWYDNVILTHFVERYGIEGNHNYEHYKILLFKSSTCAEIYIAKNKSVLASGTVSLFEHLHSIRTKEELSWRQKHWATFEEKWFETHNINSELFIKFITYILSKKNLWLCTSVDKAYIIEGPQCIGGRLKELKKKNKATVMIFTLILNKPSSPTIQIAVDVELRIYWKNGGPGSHNLCLRIN
jgi:hypothetical protein